MTGAWTHEHTFTILATAADTFRALTTAAELGRWFAERAVVEPRAGGAYRFWGRFTPGARAERDADQRIAAYDAPGELAYDWTMLGVPTSVRLRITDDANAGGPGVPGLKVALSHQIRGVLPGARPRELVDDWWRLAFGNLNAHLAGGSGILRPDLDDPRPEVRLSITVDAPPEAVWQALLDPEQLNQWIASAAVVDPRVGGRYDFGWGYQIDGRDVAGGPSVILELEAPRRLVVDWPDWRGDPSMPRQRLTWLLEPAGAGTRVTLVHDGFTRAVDVSDYPFGWGYFLSRLVAALAERRQATAVRGGRS